MLPTIRTKNLWPLYRREPVANLERILEDFWPRDFTSQNFGNLDVYDDEEHIYVEAELPGVDKDNLELSLEDGVLNLQAQRNETNETKNRNYYVRERSQGQWTRSIRLPVQVNEDNVKASFDSGILKIALEKQRKAKGRKIEVK